MPRRRIGPTGNATRHCTGMRAAGDTRTALPSVWGNAMNEDFKRDDIKLDDIRLDDIRLVERFPDVDDYRRLRDLAGMSPKTAEAARKGLPNTLYGVSLTRDGEVVGMGRIIGDGGCFYTVVDIAVAPSLQGQGLGKRIMNALEAWLRDHAEPSAYVTLVADGEARHLYAKYGFVETAPASVNMEYIVSTPGTLG